MKDDLGRSMWVPTEQVPSDLLTRLEGGKKVTWGELIEEIDEEELRRERKREKKAAARARADNQAIESKAAVERHRERRVTHQQAELPAGVCGLGRH